jgi:hypothetical protein
METRKRRPATQFATGRQSLALLNMRDQLDRNTSRRVRQRLDYARKNRTAFATVDTGSFLLMGHYCYFLSQEGTRPTRPRSVHMRDCHGGAAAHSMEESHDTCGPNERQQLLGLWRDESCRRSSLTDEFAGHVHKSSQSSDGRNIRVRVTALRRTAIRVYSPVKRSDLASKMPLFTRFLLPSSVNFRGFPGNMREFQNFAAGGTVYIEEGCENDCG